MRACKCAIQNKQTTKESRLHTIAWQLLTHSMAKPPSHRSRQQRAGSHPACYEALQQSNKQTRKKQCRKACNKAPQREGQAANAKQTSPSSTDVQTVRKHTHIHTCTHTCTRAKGSLHNDVVDGDVHEFDKEAKEAKDNKSKHSHQCRDLVFCIISEYFTDEF